MPRAGRGALEEAEAPAGFRHRGIQLSLDEPLAGLVLPQAGNFAKLEGASHNAVAVELIGGFAGAVSGGPLATLPCRRPCPSCQAYRAVLGRVPGRRSSVLEQLPARAGRAARVALPGSEESRCSRLAL